MLTRRAFFGAGAAAALASCETSSVRDRPPHIPAGTGQFTMPGGIGHEDHMITVHTYRPRNFTGRSSILIVVPGSGRNGDDYRDTWIPFADAKGLLVASPSYPEQQYDQAAYQMGGAIRNLSVGKPLPRSSASAVYLRDEDLHFDLNPDRQQWLYPDFERLFGLLRRATGSTQHGYDLFGHSAGGQILHRQVLLFPQSRARRVIAANAGFYTLPDLGAPPPTGLAGLGLDEQSLRLSFARPLTVLLGEADNDPERGGQHLHTPTIDLQGDNRLARGKFFHAFAMERARELRTPLKWQLRTAPGIGHDYRAMSRVAAGLLYP
jgi:hypothetical protein